VLLTKKLAVAGVLAVVLAAVLNASPALAQDRQLPRLGIGDRYVEASAGFSWYSPRGGGWGMITDRRVYLTGVRWEWILDAEGAFAWAYTAEWIPLAVVERTHGETINCYSSAVGRVCERDRSPRVAIGTGASPLGLKMYLNRAGNTRFFGNAAAGGLVFSTDVPVYNSRRLNYVFEYGGGVELLRHDGRAVTLGYRFHHISNGSSARINPGLDANILYVGLRRRRG